MIELSCKTDVAALQELWRVCFGNPGDLFFRERFLPEETLVWRENGAILSAMTLLPVWLAGEKGFYVYSVGTLPQARGRGLMTRLHGALTDLARQRGGGFTCLVPANAGLYELYARLGYETAFTHTARTVAFSGVPGGPELSPCGEETFLRYRETFPLWLLVSPADAAFLYRDWQADGGEVLVGEAGYAVCRTAGETVFCREWSGDQAALAAGLLAYFQKEKAVLWGPGPGTPMGMGRMLGGGSFQERFGAENFIPLIFE